MEQSSGILDSRVEQGLRETYDALTRGGKLLSPKRLAESYSTFRAHFGPDTLRSLDGPTLLNTMHAHGSKESLVYWLEFKNDDEFPGPTFGSIAGGAAFKFGLFRRKDTGQWVTGGSTSEKNISEADAVVLARKHREQLLLGMELLEALPDGADDPEYLNLQKRLELQAPDICRLVWAHKYWALLFPEKLDDFHSERWQRHNLLRVLDTPPEQAGLYVCAGRFVRLAAKFGWPINHLDSALVERNGPPAQYWRLETRRGDGSFIWPALRAGAFAAVGWGALGDLSGVAGLAKTRTAILRLLQQHYPSDPKGYAHDASQIRDFIKRVQPGDVVLAADGGRILGTGRVTGPYQYDLSGLADAPHRRAVDWRSTDEWKLSTPEGVHSTFVPIRDYSDIIQSERRLLEGQSGNGPPPPAPPRLDGIPGRIQRVLDRKGQAIVYGPPGTGKTHWARKAALDIAAIAAFGSPLAKLSDNDRNVVQGTGQADGLVRWCTFHPAYGYEDFIEGFRPHQNAAGQLIFERRDGIFKTLCTDAGRAPHRKFLLLVDEINRGDIPRIFGELLTLLENDKRGLPVSLPLSGERFVVPPNVHLLGTMNTADRSIALLDTALRRRFGFVELMPDISVLGTASAGGDIPLGPWLAALNERLRAHLGRDARNLQIGHAYLMENGEPLSDFTRFVRVLAEDLVPLLE
jgi:5-methylcytosine-specific restriction protein B